MGSACGTPTHVLELDQVAPSDAVNPNAAQVTGAPAKFAAIGIHASLGFSAAALCLGTLAAGIYALRDR